MRILNLLQRLKPPRRTRDRGRIELTADRFAVWRDDDGCYQLRWDEIDRVAAWKADLFCYDLICLGFHRVGDDAETVHLVDEEMSGYHALVKELERRHGAAMEPEWWSKVALPPFATNYTVLWPRPATAVLLAIAVALVTTATGGCQPKDPDGASTRPAFAAAPERDQRDPRAPMHRVEVTSTSAQLADSIVGRKCRVQIRRDALGLASSTVADMSGRWASVASVDGTILEMTDQWIVVQATGKRVVVPHASVLVIELQD
jgi:hypothetical protein